MSTACRAFGLLVVSCNQNVGSVDVYLTKSPRTDQDPLDGYAVVSVRLRLDSSSHGLIEQEFPYQPGGTGRLSDIAVADDWSLTVEGIDELGSVRSRGKSLPFAVGPGNTTVEVYVGRVGQFSLAAASLATARGAHTASHLSTGRWLLVGGAAELERDEAGGVALGALRSAEIVDPGSASPTLGAAEGCSKLEPYCMAQSRVFHTMTPLDAARLWIVGGDSDATTLSSSEIFTEEDQRFHAGPALEVSRGQHVALPIDGSGTLLAGGHTSDLTALEDAVLFDGSGFLEIGSLTRARRAPVAATFAGGAIVAGGFGTDGALVSAPSDIFSPGLGGFQTTSATSRPRAFGASTSLPDGRILLIGGLSSSGSIDVIATGDLEAFDPKTGDFTSLGSLEIGRFGHAATVLIDGRVLVTGGFGGNAFGEAVDDVEVIDPSALGPAVSRVAYQLSEPRAFHTATAAPNGEVFVAGGFGTDGVALSSIEVLIP